MWIFQSGNRFVLYRGKKTIRYSGVSGEGKRKLLFAVDKADKTGYKNGGKKGV